MPEQSQSPANRQQQKQRQNRLKEEHRRKQREQLLQKRLEEQEDLDKQLYNRRPFTPVSPSTVSSASSYDDWSQPFPRRPMSRLNGKKPLKLDFPKAPDSGKVTGGLRLDLNLAAEIRVHAAVHGDLTLALLG
ncbi:hypothetical protein BX666DRAFT_1877759 [Dichotomocladium elegans]|nr:hypothetical protein BX666DRAFT_1877759 [Dichotomocladium elegans]